MNIQALTQNAIFHFFFFVPHCTREKYSTMSAMKGRLCFLLRKLLCSPPSCQGSVEIKAAIISPYGGNLCFIKMLHSNIFV